MKKKIEQVYYSIHREHLCTCIGENTFRDLTTGEEFTETDDKAIRSIRPEDLLDATIVVEMGKENKGHYIRVSYREISRTQKINENVSVDIDSDGKLIGVRLNYPWATS